MQHVSASYWSVCICSTIGKHTLACNRHEIKCFLLQESNDQKCLWLCLLHSRGGARGSLPPKNFAWPPKIFRVTSWHCIEVLHRPLTAPLVAKLAPPVAPPNENVWLRPAAQYRDFTCLWIPSSSFNDAFIHTPRYFTWSKNCTRTPFRKTFDGAGCL